MEILVKDMSMPKNCASCGMDRVCRHWDIVPYKHEDCILVPVPQHGRLIDEQEIFSRFDNGIRTISSLPLPEDFVAVYVQLVKEVKEEIGKCRTVIPASKGE